MYTYYAAVIILNNFKYWRFNMGQSKNDHFARRTHSIVKNPEKCNVKSL